MLEEQINKLDYRLGDELWLDVVSADECLGLSTYPDPVRAEQSNLADCPPQILVVPHAAHLGQGGQDAAVPGVDDTLAAYL